MAGRSADLGRTSNGADRSRREAERAQRERPRQAASGRSDDTRAWFERRLCEPSFVIPEERSSSVDRGSPIRSLPEIADCRRQRANASTALGRAQRSQARERSRAFGHATVTAERRYSLLTKHYSFARRQIKTRAGMVHGTVVCASSQTRMARRGSSSRSAIESCMPTRRAGTAAVRPSRRFVLESTRGCRPTRTFLPTVSRNSSKTSARSCATRND